MASFQEDWNERQKIIDQIIENDNSFDYKINMEYRGYPQLDRNPRVYATGISGRIVSGR